MKTTIYNKICGWLAAAMVLTTTSCKDDLFNFGSELDDEVTVSFTLTSEAAVAMTTRGEEDGSTTPELPKDGFTHPGISGGSKIDVLIYAVYDEDYKLLTGYSNGTDEDLASIGFSHGDGQTIKKIEKFPVDIKITLKRGHEYTVAFWAQSSKTKAYDTSDLRKVEVKYKRVEQNGSAIDDGSNINALNNDEDRDVFCNKVTFTAGEDGLGQNVFLFRPLAQINIGTTGYDYELVTRGSDQKYIYSKIRLNRVARYLDVAKDRTYYDTTDDDKDQKGEKNAEAFSVVDFDYAPIPAYINLKKDDGTYDLPPYPSYTKYNWGDNKDATFEGGKVVYDGKYSQEEFLKVKNSKYRDDKGELTSTEADADGDGYLDYASYTGNGDDEKDTETYKYLSMCYVLTASSKGDTKEDRDVVDNVKFWMATDDNGEDEKQIFEIANVPVQRNWRTNIVGDLLTETPNLTVSMDKNFAGEYNGWSDGDNWKWTGQIADGVYYDGVADEIQISNLKGLLWFQKMVNGDLKIRDAYKLQSDKSTIKDNDKVGEKYWYYDGKTRTQFTEEVTNGYKQTDFSQEVRQRILVATHLNTWPENNNFHFTGKNEKGEDNPAKVKLMADIDLTGVKWIPIGMDYKVAEFKSNYATGKKEYYKIKYGIESEQYVNDPFSDGIADNRGFYGIFDGNGHTISNLSTRRFGVKVDEEYVEQETSPRNYDAFPWFGRGLFGNIGGNANIKNVKLVNVDIIGCNGVGGIVGIAYGQKIKIENCSVDGGRITATPMYRNSKTANKGYARGTYLGGIVGYFNTRGGELTNCAVRNVTIKGYRQVGGLIGTLDNGSNGKDPNSNSTIYGSVVSNCEIIASQMHFPFGLAPRYVNTDYKVNNVTQYSYNSEYDIHVGFGWAKNTAYDLYSNELIGGYGENESVPSGGTGFGNIYSGITVQTNFKTTDVRTDDYENGDYRSSKIRNASLANMPALSSWFTDQIELYSNYYGAPSAYKAYKMSDLFRPVARGTNETNNGFRYPMDLDANEVEIHWITSSPRVGLYVESVILNGEKAQGRSVVTPTGVSGKGSAVMFITARDRSSYSAGDVYTKYAGKNGGIAQPTTVSNMVLRGSPYAWAGVLISPNANMSTVTLDNVNIYDVYQTVALDDYVGSNGQWPNSAPKPGNVKLDFKNSNWRGYTNPGDGWQSVSYTNMVFEAGTPTAAGLEYNILKVGKVGTATGSTTFTDCTFKAPFIINMENALGTFERCEAAAAAPGNAGIDLGKVREYPGECVMIVITSNEQGEPQVIYSKKNNETITEYKFDKDGNEIKETTD